MKAQNLWGIFVASKKTRDNKAKNKHIFSTREECSRIRKNQSKMLCFGRLSIKDMHALEDCKCIEFLTLKTKWPSKAKRPRIFKKSKQSSKARIFPVAILKKGRKSTQRQRVNSLQRAILNCDWQLAHCPKKVSYSACNY